MALFYDESDLDPLAQLRNKAASRAMGGSSEEHLHGEMGDPGALGAAEAPQEAPQEIPPSYAPIKGGKVVEGYQGWVYEYVPEDESVYILHNPVAPPERGFRPFAVKRDDPAQAKAYGAIRAELEKRGVAPPMAPLPSTSTSPRAERGAEPSKPGNEGLTGELGSYLGRSAPGGSAAPKKRPSAEAASQPGLSGAAVVAPSDEAPAEAPEEDVGPDYGPSLEQMGASEEETWQVENNVGPDQGPSPYAGGGTPEELETARTGAAKKAMAKSANDLQVARLKKTIEVEGPLDTLGDATFGLSDLALGRGGSRPELKDSLLATTAGAAATVPANAASRMSDLGARHGSARRSAEEINSMPGPDSPEVARAADTWRDSAAGEKAARREGGALADDADRFAQGLTEGVDEAADITRRASQGMGTDEVLSMLEPWERQSLEDITRRIAETSMDAMDAQAGGMDEGYQKLEAALDMMERERAQLVGDAAKRLNSSVIEPGMAKDVRGFSGAIRDALDSGAEAGKYGKRASAAFKTLAAGAGRAGAIAAPVVGGLLGAPLAATGAVLEAGASPLLAYTETKKKDQPIAMMMRRAVQSEVPLTMLDLRGTDYFEFLKANPTAADMLYEKGVLSEPLMGELLGNAP